MKTKTQLAQAITVIAPSAAYENELAASREAVLSTAVDVENRKVSLDSKLRAHGVLMASHFDVIENGVIKCKWFDLQGKAKEAKINPEATLFYAMFPESNDRVAHLTKEQIAFMPKDKLRELGLFSKGTAHSYWAKVKFFGSEKEAAAKTKVTKTDTLDQANAKVLLKMLTALDKAEPASAPLSFKVLQLLVSAADLMGVDLKGLSFDEA